MSLTRYGRYGTFNISKHHILAKILWAQGPLSGLDCPQKMISNPSACIYWMIQMKPVACRTHPIKSYMHEKKKTVIPKVILQITDFFLHINSYIFGLGHHKLKMCLASTS